MSLLQPLHFVLLLALWSLLLMEPDDSDKKAAVPFKGLNLHFQPLAMSFLHCWFSNVKFCMWSIILQVVCDFFFVIYLAPFYLKFLFSLIISLHSSNVVTSQINSIKMIGENTHIDNYSKYNNHTHTHMYTTHR